MTEFYAAGKRFPLNRTYVMGILNVTPDSFSDGGKYFDPEKAVRHAVEMEAQGVDIVDIGGQSTRPGSMRISPEEEWARIENVVKAVAEKTNLAISIDTFYPEVAEKALKAGAHIINDVTGFAPEMWRAGRGSVLPGDFQMKKGAHLSIRQPRPSLLQGPDYSSSSAGLMASTSRPACAAASLAARSAFAPSR